ncbi:MAG: hypothetical protein KF836_04765 [Fimbriimonadaceae bacterium]|nr:hypothetical protein [Fimbriimonadaceae bacterium]
MTLKFIEVSICAVSLAGLICTAHVHQKLGSKPSDVGILHSQPTPRQEPKLQEKKAMKKYLLVIYSSAESEKQWASYTKEQMQAAVQKYSDYAARLKEEGRLVDAEGLSEHGKVMKLVDGKLSVTDGPYSLAKEVVGGYYVFMANDLAEATEIAKDCPGIANGGTIEVREQMNY